MEKNFSGAPKKKKRKKENVANTFVGLQGKNYMKCCQHLI